MDIRILLAAAAATVLAGCGQSDTPPATPAKAPTEVAAIRTPPPEYPVELACQEIGGTSTLRVTIGVEGTPTDIQIASSSGNAQLDEQARKAVEGWQFRAATRNGAAVPSTISVPVSFNVPKPKPDACFAIEERLRRGG